MVQIKTIRENYAIIYSENGQYSLYIGKGHNRRFCASKKKLSECFLIVKQLGIHLETEEDRLKSA